MESDRPFRRGNSSVTGLNWLLVILLILVTAYLWKEKHRGHVNTNLHNPDAQDRPIVPRGDLAEDEKSTIALFKQAAPSVVHIMSLSVQRDPFSSDVFGIPQ